MRLFLYHTTLLVTLKVKNRKRWQKFKKEKFCSKVEEVYRTEPQFINILDDTIARERVLIAALISRYQGMLQNIFGTVL